MSNDHPILLRFRAHMGRECRLLGRSWRILEILPDDGHLVLESRDAEPPIQPDQYGHATHRAPEHLELALFSASGKPSDLAVSLLEVLDERAA